MGFADVGPEISRSVFKRPVREGEVNTELTPKSLLHSDLPGNLHLLHFVNLLLPEYLFISVLHILNDGIFILIKIYIYTSTDVKP